MIILAEGATAASPYTGPLVWFCLVAAGVTLLVGLVAVLVGDLPAELAASKAAKKAGEEGQTNANEPDPAKRGAKAQGLKDLVTPVTELAKALKDLTTSGRLLVIAVLFALVAGVAAGADAIGDDPATSAGDAAEEPAGE
jgi:hypothetical protein